MSTWFRDDTVPVLLEETIQIAWNFLERAGEIDDPEEASRFLAGKIEFMIGQGQRNRLVPGDCRFSGIPKGANNRAYSGFSVTVPNYGSESSE